MWTQPVWSWLESQKAGGKKRARRIVELLNERTTMPTAFWTKSFRWRAAGEGSRQSAHPGHAPRISQISLPFIPHRATTAHAGCAHIALT